VKEFKVTKAREQIMLNESRDEVISGAGIRVRCGWKWNACKKLEELKGEYNINT
jgi:hypothetical protein